MSDVSSRRSDSTFKWLIGAGIVLIIALAGVTEEIKHAAIPIWLAAFGAMAVVLRGTLGTAMADRIAGRTGDPVLGTSDETLAELDELRRRLYEVEERMDFSERLLVARPADVARTDAPDA